MLVVILLMFVVSWLMSVLGYFKINVPWIPVTLAVIAIGLIINRYPN